MKVKLKSVRQCFGAIFEPKAVGGGGDESLRYSIACPIDPKSDNHKVLEDAIKQVAAEKWGKKAEAVLSELLTKGKVCYIHGALTKDGEVYDGFEGQYSLNAGNRARPLVIDRDKTPLTQADGKPYNGCYVNVNVDIWAQDNSYGKRINATLTGVQFVKDGEAFGGATRDTEDDFDDLADGADEDDLA